jgi:hypothetical protein
MRLGRKYVASEEKIKVGFGIEEWAMCTLTILSKSAERKRKEKCMKFQSQQTLCARTFNMENKQELSSGQNNTLQKTIGDCTHRTMQTDENKRDKWKTILHATN